jgi:hypothetical protein
VIKVQKNVRGRPATASELIPNVTQAANVATKEDRIYSCLIEYKLFVLFLFTNIWRCLVSLASYTGMQSGFVCKTHN